MDGGRNKADAFESREKRVLIDKCRQEAETEVERSNDSSIDSSID